MMKPYNQSDLTIRQDASFEHGTNGIVHTHVVKFGRALTLAERRLFGDVLLGFYHTVHFSKQFGSGLLVEPSIRFIDASTAEYTLTQTELSGPWKDLLFAIFANFSIEVAPIVQHDGSQAFAPEAVAD